METKIQKRTLSHDKTVIKFYLTNTRRGEK